MIKYGKLKALKGYSFTNIKYVDSRFLILTHVIFYICNTK